MDGKSEWQILFNTMTSHLAPVMLDVRDIATLGRTDRSGESQPDFDLAPYGAAEKGVSRRHATLVPAPNGIKIIDLQSTNGTWLNGSYLEPGQLYPLKVGDYVRLAGLTLSVQIICRLPVPGSEDDTQVDPTVREESKVPEPYDIRQPVRRGLLNR